MFFQGNATNSNSGIEGLSKADTIADVIDESSNTNNIAVLDGATDNDYSFLEALDNQSQSQSQLQQQQQQQQEIQTQTQTQPQTQSQTLYQTKNEVSIFLKVDSVI